MPLNSPQHSAAVHPHIATALRLGFHRVILDLPLDLPGYETRATDAGKSGIDGVASNVIDHLAGFGKAVHLVDHSFGASVALKIALLRPDLVKSLTRYEPVAFHLLETGNAEDRDQLAEMHEISSTLADCAEADDAECGMRTVVDFWNGRGSFDGSSDERRRRLSAMTPAVLKDFARCFAEHWTLDDLATLSMPVLVLAGMDSPEIAQNVANAVSPARLATLPGVGHMTPVYEPERVNPRIYKHIVQVEQPIANCFWPQRAAA